MNKKQAQEKIDAMRKELAALEQIVAAPEPKGLWRPAPGETYYLVDATGGVIHHFHPSPPSVWERNYTAALGKYGNCFPTREAAEKAAIMFAQAHKRIAALLQVCPELDPGDIVAKLPDDWYTTRLGQVRAILEAEGEEEVGE